MPHYKFTEESKACFLVWFNDNYKGDNRYPYKDKQLEYDQLPSDMRAICFTVALEDYCKEHNIPVEK